MNRSPFILFLLLLSLSLISCGGTTGTFAYKTVEMDSYRKFPQNFKVPQAKVVHWIFKVNQTPSGQQLGIITMQKMAVWVEIDTKSLRLDPSMPHVYGDLFTEKSGQFKVVIVEKNAVVAEAHYTVYGE